MKAASPQGVTHRIKEKAPLERGNFSAITTKRISDSATNRDAEKCFSTWQAKFAMHGHALYQTASADGAILYLSSRWGMVREMKSLEAVAAFFELIGGKV